MCYYYTYAEQLEMGTLLQPFANWADGSEFNNSYHNQWNIDWTQNNNHDFEKYHFKQNDHYVFEKDRNDESAFEEETQSENSS